MIRRSRQQKLVSEINITPFTDVILVLLVIFMITTPLLNQSNLKVNLPGAKSSKGSVETKSINITITNKGILYLEKEAVTSQELEEGLKALRKSSATLQVLLFIDEKAFFRDVSRVLDVLSGLQIGDVNIAVKPQN